MISELAGCKARQVPDYVTKDTLPCHASEPASAVARRI